MSCYNDLDLNYPAFLDLRALYEMQKSFQQMMEGQELPADLPDKMHYHLSAAIVEGAEILQLDTRWKDWKKNHKEFDKEAKAEEFADMFIFILNAMIFSDIPIDTFYDAIVNKISVNYKRQREGY